MGASSHTWAHLAARFTGELLFDAADRQVCLLVHFQVVFAVERLVADVAPESRDLRVLFLRVRA